MEIKRLLFLFFSIILFLQVDAEDYSTVTVSGLHSDRNDFLGAVILHGDSSNLAKALVADGKTLWDVRQNVKKLTIKDSQLDYLDVCFIYTLCNINIVDGNKGNWSTGCGLKELYLDSVTFAVDKNLNHGFYQNQYGNTLLYRSTRSDYIPMNFLNCTYGKCSLKRFSFTGNIKGIDGYCLYNSKVNDVILPEGLEHIGPDVLENVGLSKLVLPSTINYLSYDALWKSADTIVFKKGKVLPRVKGVFERSNHNDNYYNLTSTVFLVPLKYYSYYKQNIPSYTVDIGSPDDVPVIPYFTLEDKYTTFSFPYNLDLSSAKKLNCNFEDTEAADISFYQCKPSKEDGNVLLDKINEDVAKGTGMIIESKNDQGGTVFYTLNLSKTGVAYNENLLIGNDSVKIILPSSEKDYNNYMLGNDSFWLILDNETEEQRTLEPYKAYLHLKKETGSATELQFLFDETTKIKNIIEGKKKDNVYYNIQGQQIMKPHKGIIITNHKKIIIH